MATPVVHCRRAVRFRFLSLFAVAVLAPIHAMADPRGIGVPPEPLTPEAVEARRVQLVADIKAWLPRLVGRFRYEGVVDLNGDMESTADRFAEMFRNKLEKSTGQPQEESDGVSPPEEWMPPKICPDEAAEEGDEYDPCRLKRVHGMGDCVAIGSGPGVHCVLDVAWQGVSSLAGEVVRGEEPFLSPAMILYGLDANAASIRYLQLDKDGLTETESAVIKGNNLRWVYYTEEAKTTRRVTRIHAPPDGRFVQTVIEIEDFTPSGWRLRASITFDGRRVAPDATADDS